jgi:hypothetical protein
VFAYYTIFKYGVESNPLAYARGSLQENHDRHAEYVGVFMKWCTYLSAPVSGLRLL